MTIASPLRRAVFEMIVRGTYVHLSRVYGATFSCLGGISSWLLEHLRTNLIFSRVPEIVAIMFRDDLHCLRL